MAKQLAANLNADVQDIRKFETHYRVGLFSFNKLKFYLHSFFIRLFCQKALFFAQEGRLDKKSFEKWFATYYALGQPDYTKENPWKYNEFVGRMFDLFDIDNDGHMSFEE